MSDEPRITIYGKVLDNKTQSLIKGYHEWTGNSVWNYGEVNGINGGESPYVIELDIWNNEPAFNGLSGNDVVADATNCKLTVWNNDNCVDSSTMKDAYGNFFMKVRCITKDINSQYQQVAGPTMFSNLRGNVGNGVNPNLTESDLQGRLQGVHGGDHTIIQTKIVLPDNQSNGYDPIPSGDKNFVFAFHYDFE